MFNVSSDREAGDIGAVAQRLVDASLDLLRAHGNFDCTGVQGSVGTQSRQHRPPPAEHTHGHAGVRPLEARLHDPVAEAVWRRAVEAEGIDDGQQADLVAVRPQPSGHLVAKRSRRRVRHQVIGPVGLSLPDGVDVESDPVAESQGRIALAPDVRVAHADHVAVGLERSRQLLVGTKRSPGGGDEEDRR